MAQLDGTPIEAICLDLDDTILDGASSVRASWERAAAELASAHPELEGARTLATLERVRDWYWEDAKRHRTGRLDLEAARTEIVARSLDALGRPDDALAALVGRRLTVYRDEALRLVDGALETLARLRRAVPRLALVTNGAAAPQRAKIDRFGLADLFDHVQIEGEFGAGKPDPRVYEHVLLRLGSAPGRSLMVGDNYEWDVAAPLTLGMQAAWIDVWKAGRPPRAPPRPHRTLAALPELADLLGC